MRSPSRCQILTRACASIAIPSGTSWHTGGQNEHVTDGPVARITVYHGAGRPSRIRYRQYTGPVEVAN